MILCTWILIGLGAYRSKWATGGSHGGGGSSLTGCSIRFAATDKLTIDRYAHRPSIWHCRDSGCSLPLTWSINRNDEVLAYYLCYHKLERIKFLMMSNEYNHFMRINKVQIISIRNYTILLLYILLYIYIYIYIYI